MENKCYHFSLNYIKHITMILYFFRTIIKSNAILYIILSNTMKKLNEIFVVILYKHLTSYKNNKI